MLLTQFQFQSLNDKRYSIDVERNKITIFGSYICRCWNNKK